MKKRITAIALIAMAFLVNNAYAEKIDYTKNEDGKVVITAKGFESNVSLAMTVYLKTVTGGVEENFIKQIDEETTDSSGNAEFTFNFFPYDPSGTYYVSMQDESMLQNTEVVEIEFINELALKALNDAKDADELLRSIKEYSIALNVDKKLLENVDENKISKTLFAVKETYNKDNFKDFQDLYFEVCVLERIAEAESNELEGILNTYSCGIDISENSDYYKLSDDGKEELKQRIAGKVYNSLDELADVWKEQTALTIIKTVKYPAIYSWIAESDSVGLTENYEKILGFDGVSKYSSLKDEKAPFKEIAGDDFQSIEAAKTAFESAVDSQYKLEHKTTTGGGSSSSGGGGGIPAVNFVDSSDKTNNEEIVESTENEYYSDISDYGWAKESIEALTDRNILSGTGNGKFMPQNNVTREEFLKMLILALDLPIIKGETEFSDVNENNWFYDYVSTGVSVGIVNGISENEFGSGAYVTRADIAVMIERASKIVGIELKANAERIDFADNSEIPEYAKTSVEKVQMSGIINGYTDRTFKPLKTATRAESAVLICNLLNFN